MEDFIKVAGTMDEDLIYLTQISQKLRDGQKVRIVSGSFAGVEGTVVRIRKSRRIMVELPGMLAVASTYVPLEKAAPLIREMMARHRAALELERTLKTVFENTKMEFYF
jgi:hypothetical protein